LRVLLLGVGAVGEVIARHIAGEAKISLSVADVNEARLQRIKRTIRDVKIRVEKITTSDFKGLEELIKQHDLLLNAATPSLNLTLMNLCLKNDVNYIDLASDNIEEQLSLHRKFMKKGLLALICLGEDPGLSNIYARYAADRLEKVHEIRIRDGEFSKSRKYPLVALFSPQVFFDELLSPAYVYQNGRYLKLPPFSAHEVYEFPNPIGRMTVYAMEHEEIFTLPKFIGKGPRYVDFKLALSDELIKAVKLLKRIGLLKTRKIRVKGAKVAPKDLFFALIPQPSDVSKYIEGYASLVVDVQGEVNNRPVTYTIYTLMSHKEAFKMFKANATAYLTGTVPAVITTLIAKQEIEEKGVQVPEQLEPEPIIEMVAEKKIITNIKTSEESVMLST